MLFLHGALPSKREDGDGNQESIYFPTPWIQAKVIDAPAECDTLSDWIDAVNSFASSQVLGWRDYHKYCLEHQPQQCSSNGVWATEGGFHNGTLAGKLFGALLQYGMGTLPGPTRIKTESCVYNSWMHNGLPRNELFGSDATVKQLLKQLKQEGIQLILTGHQPVGDAPWPIQITTHEDDTKLMIIPCDTSFSGDTRWATLEGYNSTDIASLGRGSDERGGRGDVAFR